MWSGKDNVDRAVRIDPEAEPTLSHIDALQNALRMEEVLENQVDMIIGMCPKETHMCTELCAQEWKDQTVLLIFNIMIIVIIVY